MQLGQLIQSRRTNMGMSLNALSRELGGSPGASFLSRIESGQVDTSVRVCTRLAEVLSLPAETLLNAAGYATPAQADTALVQLQDIVGTPAPVMQSIPVVIADDPEQPESSLPRRSRLLRQHEDVFLIDLAGRENEPFVGEVLASRARKPKQGQPVVAIVDGRAGAWTWHSGRPTGDFVSREGGDKTTKFKVLGVILRVVSELNLE